MSERNIPTESELTTREEEWAYFSAVTASHIFNYANTQYGNKGEDQCTGWTKDDMLRQNEKYVNRNKGKENARGRVEALRDMVKQAHYACIAFWKMDPTKEEIEKIINGEM